MLWFGVRLPYFALEVSEGGELKGGTAPAVVTDVQRICLVNEPARAAGIRVNASLATARSLLPNLAHYARDREAEVRQMNQLVVATYKFTPSVSMVSENELLLEMAGSLKLFHGVNKARRFIGREFLNLGHHAEIGIAHTPRASLAFAKRRAEVVWPDFPSDNEACSITLSELRKTALGHLELTPKDRERFANMGMHLTGDLMDIPSHELQKRFGPDLVVYLSQLTGDRLDPWLSEQPIDSFNERLHLIDPLRGKDEVLEPMEHLADKLSGWLKHLNLGARRLRWGVYAFEGDGATFEVGFEQPRDQVEDIMAITRLRLEWVDLPSEAMTVALDALRTDSLNSAWGERDLLGGSLTRGVPSRELIDRLIARLGSQALQQFQILDDHRPEFAWMPVGEGEGVHAAKSIPECGRRPLWLLEPPKPIRSDQLRIVSGPERIQYGWWENELRRDYYVAQDRDDVWCWCFRNAEGWFLHGYFA